jgi:hypothetical protein
MPLKLVVVHPINQSGSSSREVCDIDVKDGKKAVIGFEVKDKKFYIHDVQHAASKASKAGLQVIGIVSGPSGEFVGQESEVKKLELDLGISIIFINVFEASNAYLLQFPEIQSHEFLNKLFEIFEQARVKDQVKIFAEIAAKKSGLT